MRGLAPSFLLLLLLLSWTTQLSECCELIHSDDATETTLREMLTDDSVRVVEYTIAVDGYSRGFWTAAGGDEWFQPWNWYRVKGIHSQRLLLLFHYYYGILKPYMAIGARTFDVSLEVNDTGCLTGLSSLTLESKLRDFLYYDLKNVTEKQETKLSDDVWVCSQRVGDFSGWGRLVYHCCSRNDAGQETCTDVSDDDWVWILRAFIVIITILLFLYFPKLIPKGYYVYSFQYHPPDGQSFNLLVTANPAKYRSESSTSTVLPAARWRNLRKFAGEVRKLPLDVVHRVKIKRVTLECGMDRLLSETSSPVSVFRSFFDTWIRCKVRHADSLEECCNAPVCGELCCPRCPPWFDWMRALRTILLLLLLAVPALPILYVMAADHLEYQELARIIVDRGLSQSNNFYLGSVLGKVVVSLLAGLYVLHVVLVVLDGCHDQNLAKAYTELLHVTRHNAKIRDRLRASRGILRKIFWPVKRFGVVAVPLCVILLLLLPVLLLMYLIVTAPVPKLLLHSMQLMAGKTTSRRHKSKAELSIWGLLENLLFVVTLVDVFAVLTLGLNFLVHVLIVALVQLIVNVAFLMKFFTILVLLVVYIRDAFRLVNNTYAAHHSVVMSYVTALEAEDIKAQADKDWKEQENLIFKIVPTSAVDCKGRAGKEEEEYRRKKLFMIKNDALRMRTRSLVFFLDKEDVPYIPKKFLEHTTTLACPGSPGRLEEAYLRALGRFARTVLFLVLVLLPLLAYASTYEVSNNLQFFAILFTGTIPLVMRYFFMSPGAMLTVNTSTLRFQTQMDDKIESFMQSWVVEDVVVEHFRHAHEDHPRHLHNHPDGAQTRQDADDTQSATKQPLPSPPLHAKHAYDPGSAGGKTGGHLNYFHVAPTIDVENNDDWLQYQSTDTATAQQPDGTDPHGHGPLQSQPRAHKPHKKKKSAEQREVPLVDDLQAMGKEGPLSSYTPTPNGIREKDRQGGKESKRRKGKKKKVKIDLILDISGDQLGSRLAEEEKGAGV
ncbi:hypothetical protein ACOMHN_008833 [Nucella lapillus]